MVDHAPAGGHAAGGDDDHRAAPFVQRAGFVGRVDDLRGVAHGRALLLAEPVLVAVAPVHLGRIGSHGAVQEDGQLLGYRPTLLEQMDAIHQRLRTAHRERRNHQHAAPRGRAFDDLRQLRQHVHRFMQPVAVGGLGHQVVRAGHGHRGLEHQIVRAPQVAGEEDGAATALDAHEGRSHHVAGGRQARLEARGGAPGLEEIDGFDELERLPCIGFGIERRRRLVLGEAMSIGIGSFLLLQMPAVGQHDAAQFARGLGAEDLAAKALFDQQGQVAGVVQVRMGQDEGIHRGRHNRQRVPVAQPQLLVALEQAAIDHQRRALMAQQVLGACDRAGGTEELDLHGLVSLNRCGPR